MAQLVEGDLPHAASLERIGKALAQLGCVEDMACLRVAEDQVVLADVGGALEVALELGGDAIGQRHRPPFV